MNPAPAWPRQPIAELCDISSGRGFGPKDWAKAGLPIIRIQNLNGSHNFNFFAGQPEPEWLVEPGDLLFAWAGVRGVSFGPTIWSGPRGVLNQHIYRVRPRRGVVKLWLYALLKVITSTIEQKAHGFKKSLVHVRKSDITRQVWPVPEPEEQERVVAVISSWSRALELIAQLLSMKQDLMRGLTQRLLTGASRFHQFADDPWNFLRFDTLFAESRDQNADSSVANVITVGKHAVRPQGEHFHRSVASRDLSNYWLIRPGDFVYDPMSAYYGAIGRYESLTLGIVSPAYRVIRLRSGVNSDFMRFVLKCPAVAHQLRARSSQSNKTGKRRTLSRKEFDSITVCMPAQDEQDRIAEVLTCLERDLAILERQRDVLEKQKRTLMHKLVSGEIRINVEL